MTVRARARRALIRTSRWLVAQRHDAIVLVGLCLLAYGLGQLHPSLAPITIGIGLMASVRAGQPERR